VKKKIMLTQDRFLTNTSALAFFIVKRSLASFKSVLPRSLVRLLNLVVLELPTEKILGLYIETYNFCYECVMVRLGMGEVVCR
jgi:hypothetical protein